MLFKTVLAISPHTDDAEICAGGLIRKLVEDGSSVYSFICTTLGDRKNEVLAASKILGFKKLNFMEYPIRSLPDHRNSILQKFVNLKKKLKPDLVLVPAQGDTHQDHKVVWEEAFRAFKNATIWGWEIPWNMQDFKTHCFVGLTEKQLARKMEAINCYYPSQSKRMQEEGKVLSTYEEYVRALAVIRGAQSDKFHYAEAFEVIKQQI